MGNLDSLPVEVALNILKRLNIDSVIQYRLVSRTWNYLGYHRLLDYVKETHVELERKAKEVKRRWRSAYFRKLKETMEFIKQGIINGQKNSGGPNTVLDFRKILRLKKITDTGVKCCRIYLDKSLERKIWAMKHTEAKVEALNRLCARKRHVLKKLRSLKLLL